MAPPRNALRGEASSLHGATALRPSCQSEATHLRTGVDPTSSGVGSAVTASRVSLHRALCAYRSGVCSRRNCGVAGITVTLLLTVPVNVFSGVAAGATWLIMIGSILLTVADAVRTTRNDGLHTGLLSGHIHAYIPDPV